MKVDQNTKSQSAAKVPGSSKQPDDKKIETQLNVTSIATDNSRMISEPSDFNATSAFLDNTAKNLKPEKQEPSQLVRN